MAKAVERSMSLVQVKAVIDTVVDILAGGDVSKEQIDGVTEILVMLAVQLENQMN